MSGSAGVTLQINLAPTDLPHAIHIVPHQLRQWAGQVDEVLLTLDLHRSRGRFAAAWAERAPGMRRLIAELCAQYAHARVSEVDYSEDMRERLADAFFGGRRTPEKDWNGGPFYSYFYGLHAAAHEYVLHMDSDMMFGGGSQTWAAEAVRLLERHEHVVACNPLPGAPTADGALRSQTLDPFPHSSLAYSVSRLSTRIFLLDRARFHRIFPALPLLPAPTRLREWQARLDGNPPFGLPEEIISHAMTERGVLRVDFLGDAPGMWTVHPPYRSAEFYARLPELIARIEAGDVPEGQRGMHDMNDSMIDWRGARAPRWRRIASHARLALSRPFAVTPERAAAGGGAGLVDASARVPQ
jgi:hypothetical protein